MLTRILFLSDIHANYPALAAIDRETADTSFALILNGGDTTVFAPFPNETLDWLRRRGALSILGNTDRKVLKLLRGESFTKPRKEEKRVMYTWTAEELTPENGTYLRTFPAHRLLTVEGWRIGLFHGSPADADEFLFADTPPARFRELAAGCGCDIVLVGHSHSPFHKEIDGVHFINPGSVGRMFDGSPDGAYAVIDLSPAMVRVRLHRCPYPVDEVIRTLRFHRLPPIYEDMYRQGRKLN